MPFIHGHCCTSYNYYGFQGEKFVTCLNTIHFSQNQLRNTSVLVSFSTVETRVAQSFKKSKRQLKFTGTRMVPWSKIRTEGPQILRYTVQNLLIMATWHLGYVYLWYWDISFWIFVDRWGNDRKLVVFLIVTNTAVFLCNNSLSLSLSLSLYIYIYIYIYIHTHTQTHTNIYIYINKYKYIYIYIHTHKHTQTYIYIYIYKHSYVSLRNECINFSFVQSSPHSYLSVNMKY